jgi:Major Facilitator Superfamily
VARVAAWRSRQLTRLGIAAFRRAATADGADRSGLTALTFPVMASNAADASLAVALANTLFFSAATAESKTKVALYLLITVAPFALLAPVIGPLLDRLQRGRRVALAASFVGRALLAIVLARHFGDWLLYPAALGFMVLTRSFGLLKAAVTPRVLPPGSTLTKTNSRLAVFGLAAGGVVGAVAAGLAFAFGSPGALWFTTAVCLIGAWLCLRIPAWVEVTEGEVTASLRHHDDRHRHTSDRHTSDRHTSDRNGDDRHGEAEDRNGHPDGHASGEKAPGRRREPLTQHVVVALWGNGTIRILTGFLTLFVAFVVKAQTEHSPWTQLVLLGMVGAAAGAGNILGNALGARQHFGKPDQVILTCVGIVLGSAMLAALMGDIATAVLVGLVGSTCSSLAKVCQDAVIQRDMSEESRASAFGRTETILQLAWTFGGALGVLLPPIYWLGFTVVCVLMSIGTVQTALAHSGRSLIPSVRKLRLPKVRLRPRLRPRLGPRQRS